MAIGDYFGLIPLIFLVLIIIEIWRFFSVGGKGQFGAKLKKFNKPGWLKMPFGKEEGEIEKEIEKGEVKDEEFGARLAEEEKNLQEGLEEEKELEKKKEKVDDAQEQQEKKIVEDLKKLDGYIGIARQLPAGDPKTEQYIGAIDWQIKKIGERYKYIEKTEKFKKQAEDQQEKTTTDEEKNLRKEYQIGRRRRKLDKRDLGKVMKFLKKIPPGPKRDKWVNLRNKMINKIYGKEKGDKIINAVLQEERKLAKEKETLVKKEEKISEKKIEKIRNIQQMLEDTAGLLTKKEKRSFLNNDKEREKWDKYHEDLDKLDKEEEEIRKRYEDLGEKMIQASKWERQKELEKIIESKKNLKKKY